MKTSIICHRTHDGNNADKNIFAAEDHDIDGNPSPVRVIMVDSSSLPRGCVMLSADIEFLSHETADGEPYEVNEQDEQDLG